MPVLAGIDVRGISVGGVETCIDLPQWRFAFDIGRAPDFAVPRATILFTHAHMDHMGGVAWHCATRALRGLEPPTYVVARENADAFRDLFDVWRRLDRSKLPHRLVVLGPGETHAIGPTRHVRPFHSPHRAPCQGYAVWSRRTRLAAAFRGVPQAEIDAARRSGATIGETADVCELAFPGDTLVDVLEREESVRTARVLVLECTFLDDRVSVSDSRAMGHVHLDEIVERADLFQNEAILLTHFSARYAPEQVRALLDRKLPPTLRARVTPLLPDP